MTRTEKYAYAALGILCGALFSLIAFPLVRAETNIGATQETRHAWDDTNGWWDFNGTDTVLVKGTRVEGYASSSIGDMSLDCTTSPLGSVCASSNYGICNGPGPHNTDGTCPNGDASGVLSGYAWNDTIGWISFNCDQSTHGGTNQCTTSNYKVEINSDGDFTGYAWNDIAGWISFNCANNSSCASSDYKVNTTWRATSSLGYLESSVFDTETTAGALLNSIIWQGDSPGGTCVDFQIAASNSPSGPWQYRGPSGDSSTYYGLSCASSLYGGVGCALPNVPICVLRTDFVGYRYLRYKVRLASDLLQTETPVVTDIILNWSP